MVRLQALLRRWLRAGLPLRFAEPGPFFRRPSRGVRRPARALLSVLPLEGREAPTSLAGADPGGATPIAIASDRAAGVTLISSSTGAASYSLSTSASPASGPASSSSDGSARAATRFTDPVPAGGLSPFTDAADLLKDPLAGDPPRPAPLASAGDLLGSARPGSASAGEAGAGGGIARPGAGGATEVTGGASAGTGARLSQALLEAMAASPAGPAAAVSGDGSSTLAGTLGTESCGEFLYSNNFEGPVGDEWSNTQTDTTPAGGRNFLGQFGNQTVSLTLTNLPAHVGLTLSFDLFVLRSWDGNGLGDAGPDTWEVGVAGGPDPLLRTTFSNIGFPVGDDPDGKTQAYPNPLGQGDNPARTGAEENDTLGYDFFYSSIMETRLADSVYRLTFSFAHTADSVTFNFAGSGLQALTDESWGLDNVTVDDVEVGTTDANRQPLYGPSGDFQDTGAGVMLHNGAFSYQAVDLEIPGRGLNWQFARTYRSDVVSEGPLGHNWDFNYNRRLVRVTDDNVQALRFTFPEAQLGDVVVRDGALRDDLYVRNGDGTFTPPPGFFSRLVPNVDGSFTERYADGTIISYGSAHPVTGLAPMTSMADRNFNTLIFVRNAQGRLDQVIDTMGRVINYVYSGHLLTAVQDFFGRTLSFAYDDCELVAATSPAVTGTPTNNNFPGGKTERYGYVPPSVNARLNHNLVSITAPNEVASGGPPRVQLSYETNPNSPNFDRVLQQGLGGASASGVPSGGTIVYGYEALVSQPPPAGDLTTAVFETTVTDRNGNVTQYRFNQLNNLLQQTEFTNRGVRANEPDYTTAYAYNGDYLLTLQTFPEGNTVAYDYDEANPDRFQQGNLLSASRAADPDRGGDQTALVTSSTYELVYNQLRTAVDPRGHNPDFRPPLALPGEVYPNPERYTAVYTYDYQEGANFAGLAAVLGVTETEVQQRLMAAGIPTNLGDVNGDGRTDQIAGNLIRVESPTVNLLPGSNQAAVEGDTEQQITQLYRYNDFGQMTANIDPEQNVDRYEYYPEEDPDGDGQDLTPGRDPSTGGYLRQMTRDTDNAAGRNSGTDPTPTAIRSVYLYDRVGNVVREIDGRGIATDYAVNQLNQVVQVVRAAAVGLYGSDPGEPLPLTSFQYRERTFYDFNDNVVLRQVEDRGNTSAVDGSLPEADLPAGVPGLLNADPLGGPAFVDTSYRYDILDQQVAMAQEVSNGASTEFLRTRSRYDPNGNSVLTILPEGNATSAVYDERDLVFQTTRGALGPPPLVLLAAGDPVNYDTRGGLLCQCSTFHYDGNRNVIETVDAADTDGSPDNNSDRGGPGDRTRFVYDGFDRKTSTIDSVGNQSVAQYDPAGNVVRVLRFGPVGGPSPTGDGPDVLPGPVSQLGVVQTANLVNATLLAATESLHDELNRVFQSDQVLFVNTTPTVRTPDVADGAADIGKGNLTPGDDQAIPGVSGIDILGRVSTRSEYDRNSRMTFTVEDDGDTARTFYDGASRVIVTVDPEGNTVETAYDDNSNVIEMRETDVAQVAGIAAEAFLTTSFYDSLNRLERTVDNLGQTLSYRYDSRDNLVAMADAQGPMSEDTLARRAFPNGARTVNEINAFGNVTRYFYDGLSRQTRQEVILTASGEGDGEHIGASLFGVKDDPAVPESFAPSADPAQGGGDGIIRTGSIWDGNSLQTARLDDQGNVTVWLYDNQDRPITETKGITVDTALTKATILGDRQVVTPTLATIDDPAVISESQLNTQLAAAQARIDAVAPLFPALADQIDPPPTIVTGYDAEGNVLIHEDENDTETFTRYDALNRVVAVRVFRNGQPDSHASDPFFAPNPQSDPNNLSTFTVVGTTAQDFEYDGLSRQTAATDNNDPNTADDDSVLTFAYDSLSRLLEETQQVGGLPTRAISSAWRAENLRTGLTYPDERVVLTTFDDLDRVDTIADAGAAEPTADYNYLGAYRVLERLSPLNGTRLTYLDDAGTADAGYDGLRRPVQLRHLRDDNSLAVGFTHSYDRMNNKLTEGKLHSSENSEIYAYDSAYRLINFERAPGGQAPMHGTWHRPARPVASMLALARSATPGRSYRTPRRLGYCVRTAVRTLPLPPPMSASTRTPEKS